MNFFLFFFFRVAHKKKKVATPQRLQAPFKQKLFPEAAFQTPLQHYFNGPSYRDGEVLFEASGFTFIQ